MTNVSTKDTTEVKKTTRSKKSTKKNEEKVVNSEDMILQLMQQIEMLKSQINTPVKEEVDKKAKPTVRINKTTMFQEIKNNEVPVKRIVGGMGVVYWNDKRTGDEFYWNEEGEIQYLTVDALKRMNSSQLFLKTPWLEVMDDDACEVLNLVDLYNNIKVINDFDKLVTLQDGEIEAILKKLSNEFKQTLATNIMSKIASNEINDMRVIRRFERLLNKEFLN